MIEVENLPQQQDLEINLLKSDRKMDKYKLYERIGSGTFGNVYKAYNKKTKRLVALKIETKEKRRYNKSHNCNESSLLNQIKIYQRLKGIKGIPRIYSTGKCRQGIYIQMELFQKSLQFERQNKFSIKQISQLGLKILQVLKQIHGRNVIHRDLKPQNIMINQKKQIIIVDFGLSCIRRRNKQVFLPEYGFLGTPKYASLAAHQGKEQCTSSDIESLLYILGFLYFKESPWSYIKGQISQRFQYIASCKKKYRNQWLKKLGDEYINILNLITLGDQPIHTQISRQFLKSIKKNCQSSILETSKSNLVSRQNQSKQQIKVQQKASISQSKFSVLNTYETSTFLFDSKNKNKQNKKQSRFSENVIYQNKNYSQINFYQDLQEHSNLWDFSEKNGISHGIKKDYLSMYFKNPFKKQ